MEICSWKKHSQIDPLTLQIAPHTKLAFTVQRTKLDSQKSDTFLTPTSLDGTENCRVASWIEKSHIRHEITSESVSFHPVREIWCSENNLRLTWFRYTASSSAEETCFASVSVVSNVVLTEHCKQRYTGKKMRDIFAYIMLVSKYWSSCRWQTCRTNRTRTSVLLRSRVSEIESLGRATPISRAHRRIWRRWLP